jgi:hypothetical protein
VGHERLGHYVLRIKKGPPLYGAADMLAPI